MDFRLGGEFDFDDAAAFAARLVEEIRTLALPEGTLLHVHCPADGASGARACRLGRRIYRDKLQLASEQENRRRQYRISGEAPPHPQDRDTALPAIAEGRIPVTPLPFDLTSVSGLEQLGGFDLDRLIR